MPYSVTAFKLMISCPSDAEDECRVILEQIRRWNGTHSEKNRTVLVPIFHKTDVPPVLAPSDDKRPQATVNKYLVSMCDCLVAIFKNRIGTPTGRAESGTLEEIDLFCQSNPPKPVLIYFLESTTDPKIKAFKEKWPGYWKEYKECTGLGSEFFINLSQVVNREPYFTIQVIDEGRRIQEKAQLLLIQAGLDAKNLLNVSRVSGSEAVITTNGIKFMIYESAIEHLVQKQFVGKFDGQDDIYVVTDRGKQEIERIKQFAPTEK